MRTYSTVHPCWVKPDMQPIVVQKLGLDPVSPTDAKLNVGCSFSLIRLLQKLKALLFLILDIVPVLEK